MFFSPLCLLLVIPGMIIAGIASFYTHSTFMEFSRKRASSGMTGAQAAERMLRRSGLTDVAVERTEGFLSDHYDPLSRTLRLSPKVYDEDSLSAIGVACHEAGHALQDAAGYAPLQFRSALVPITNFASPLSYFLILLGVLLHAGGMIMTGAIVFGLVVLFSIATLPVEWNASARAKKMMVTAGIVDEAERDDAAKVLNAAYLTYLAAVLSSLLWLLYYILRAVGMNRRD